jgi:hypothetical protein
VPDRRFGEHRCVGVLLGHEHECRRFPGNADANRGEGDRQPWVRPRPTRCSPATQRRWRSCGLSPSTSCSSRAKICAVVGGESVISSFAPRCPGDLVRAISSLPANLRAHREIVALGFEGVLCWGAPLPCIGRAGIRCGSNTRLGTRREGGAPRCGSGPRGAVVWDLRRRRSAGRRSHRCGRNRPSR